MKGCWFLKQTSNNKQQFDIRNDILPKILTGEVLLYFPLFLYEIGKKSKEWAITPCFLVPLLALLFSIILKNNDASPPLAHNSVIYAWCAQGQLFYTCYMDRIPNSNRVILEMYVKNHATSTQLALTLFLQSFLISLSVIIKQNSNEKDNFKIVLFIKTDP